MNEKFGYGRLAASPETPQRGDTQFCFVIDELVLRQMNGSYTLPPDAGPAWRAAHEAGVDMSLIESALRLTPEQRLAEHQQVIDFLLEVRAAGKSYAAE